VTKDETRKAIRVECEKRGWSVMDLAGKTQVSPEAIRRFVTGHGDISAQVLTRLLKALGLYSGFLGSRLVS
jgi:plasmid maintenance system antidote protein VapI